ncbi:hypothetical protein RYX36_027529 [Vicia faba]
MVQVAKRKRNEQGDPSKTFDIPQNVKIQTVDGLGSKSSISEHAPTANQFTTEEGPRLHIPLKTDNHVVSDFEGEPSSIIACALSLLKDSSEMSKIDGDVKESGITSKSTDSLHDSLDSDSAHSTGSVSLEESRSFRATEDHSKEVHLGYAKITWEGKIFCGLSLL